MFKTAKFHRISQNIVQQIRKAILRGDLKPGDRLPPEKELAEHFGVSKASLREAFRALEALGLLEVRQGVSGGAFIREVNLETARDNIANYIYFQNPSIEEFTQLRSILEPSVAEMAATRVRDEDLIELEDNLIETKKRLDEGTFSYELDIAFHRRIALIAQNCLICLIIDAIQSALVNIKHLLEPDYDFCVEVYLAHRNIYDALKCREPHKAKKQMERHILEVERGLISFCHTEEPTFIHRDEERIRHYPPQSREQFLVEFDRLKKRVKDLDE